MLKKKNILTLLLFSAITYAESTYIEVDISEQRLYLIENSLIKASYPISTSKYGEGSIENSFKTPLGEHSIKEMIGEEAEINTIFTSRINTNPPSVKQCEIILKLEIEAIDLGFYYKVEK